MYETTGKEQSLGWCLPVVEFPFFRYANSLDKPSTIMPIKFSICYGLNRTLLKGEVWNRRVYSEMGI
jgi:hypothetical protein